MIPAKAFRAAPTIAVLTVLAMAGSVGVAQADPVEGAITYTGGSASNPADIDPLDAGAISGSKTATDLDTNDRSNVTISFPAADYLPHFDIVVVSDGTSSYDSVLPHVEQMVADLVGNLATRPNMRINFDMVLYAPFAYQSITITDQTKWDDFVSAVQDGTLSTYSASVPGKFLPMLPTFVGLGAGWPADSVSMGTTAKSYADLAGGLQPLNASTATSLTDTMALNASRFEIQYMMTYCIYAGCGLTGAAGYSMGPTVVGSNLDAGIRAGQALLDGDPATPQANKHLLILTDGGSYFWNDPTNDPALQTSGGRWTGGLSWGQPGGDWASFAPPRASDAYLPTSPATALTTPYDYAGFLANTDVATNTMSQMTMTDAIGYYSTPQTYFPDNTMLTSNFYARAQNLASPGDAWYPYISLEKGTAHAAMDLAGIKAGSPLEHVVVIGKDYNPATAGVTYIAKGLLMYARDLFGADNYFDLTDGTTTIAMAFDSVVGRVSYALASGVLQDEIGPQFHLVTAPGGLEATDIVMTLGGVTVPCVMSGGGHSQIICGDADGQTGLYPYVITVGPFYGTTLIELTINVPVESGLPLTMTYTLQLDRQTSPAGWHENVVLNQLAMINYTDTAAFTGSDTFPVPATSYFVASVAHGVLSDTGGNLVGQPWLAWLGAGLLLTVGAALWRRQSLVTTGLQSVA